MAGARSAAMMIDEGGGEDVQWEHAVSAPNGAIYGIPGAATSVLKIVPEADAISRIGATTDSSPRRWSAAILAPSGAIYGVPFSASAVLRVDTFSDEVRLLGSLGPACCKWRHAVVSGDRIYGIPFAATGVLKVSLVTESVEVIGNLPEGPSKWSEGIVAAGSGNIYAVPYSARAVLKVGVITDEVSMLGDLGDAMGKWGACISAMDGAIYGIPASAESVLRIDPMTDTVETFGALGPGGQKWSRPVTTSGGAFIVALPDAAPNVLRIDPRARTAEAIGFVGGGGLKWSFGAGSPLIGRAVYAVPFLADEILRVDAAAGAVTELPLGGHALAAEGTGKWAGGLQAPSGVIYGVPDGASAVVKIDPSSGAVAFMGRLGLGVGKWRAAALSRSGDIYAVPGTAEGVLKIDVQTDTVEVIGFDGSIISPSGEAAQAPHRGRTRPLALVEHATLAFCIDYQCGGDMARRHDAASLVCRSTPCDRTCCLPKHPSMDAALIIPLALLLTSASVCALRQAIRCKTENLRSERLFRVTYFTIMFVWDVFDQAASWWFWSYTVGLGASWGVQAAALSSAVLGVSVLLVALMVGLCLKTRYLVDAKLPEFAYSVGAAVADIIMLVAVYAFEMEGLDEGSFVKTLNLIATIVDFASKILQASWSICSPESDPKDALLDSEDELTPARSWQHSPLPQNGNDRAVVAPSWKLWQS